MRKVLITQLVQQANEAIKPIHYSASTVYQYNLAWNRLAQFFSDNGTIHYSEELANRFVEESKCELVNDKEWRYKLYRLSVCILTEVYETGAYKWRFHSKDPNRSLKMELQKIHRTYSQKLIQSGKGSGTCDCYEVVARQFLKYLQEELHIGTEELQLSDISGFIPYLAKLYQVTSMRTALSALRSFLTFLYQEGYSMVNLLPAVPSSCARKSAIVPTITVEEESCLLQAIDRSKNQGKRDYAMLLLAIRTGLRSIDIINLKLSDIDWYEKVLSIIQQKTGKPLTLPLMPDVGNALADYILNARPESSLPYVFLRSTLPYGKLSGCYSISRSIMDKANVRQSEKQSRGFHVYRHSVAARMLANEVPLSVISNALGHVSMASSKTYLSTDKEHLKACSLSLEGIEVAKEELR